MKEKTNGVKKVAIGAAVGAAAGFVAGVLMAPKSGKETRDDLKKGAKAAVKNANKQLKNAHEELSKFVDKAETQAARMGSAAKREALDALEKGRKTRDQAATIIAAVKSGNSSDEDLDMAVKNAKNALESLKQYFDHK